MLTPARVALLSFLLGVGLAVGGVFLLAGAGWAMVAAAVPFLAVFLVLSRGLIRAQ